MSCPPMHHSNPLIATLEAENLQLRSMAVLCLQQVVKNPSLLLLASAACWHSLGFLGLQMYQSDLCLCHHWAVFLLCLSGCLRGVVPLCLCLVSSQKLCQLQACCNNLILTCLHLQIPYFQIKYHPQGLRVRNSLYLIFQKEV